MGLGLLGRGVGDVAYLAECGAELIVTDRKSKEELAPSLEQLATFPNITYVLGEHREEDFKGRDIVIVAAGVPLESPYVAVAREDGAEVAMSGALFAKLSGIPIIGVTGTRGKSTVTHMIHHVLTETTEGGNVLLGGNVRGVSNLQLLKEVQDDSIAVMELDSWQLQGFGWAGISPQIAVFTSFMDDHLNYYHEDRDAYFADKAQIFLHQKDTDVFVTTTSVFDRARSFAKGRGLTISQEVVLTDTSVLPENLVLTMPGEHNRLNAALAYEALKATSLEDEVIFQSLARFPGVPGRLELLREIRGVKIYNDNNATTPSATAAGLAAVADGKNVVLIAGGSDKNIDLTPLVEAVGRYAKAVVVIPGAGTDKLKALVEVEEVDTLQMAVERALAVSESGDVILFSPAFASFGMFTNEYDRNDQFVDLVRQR